MEKNSIEIIKELTGWIEGTISDREKLAAVGIKVGSFIPYQDNPEQGMFEGCSIDQATFSKLATILPGHIFEFKTAKNWESLKKHRERK